MVSSREFLYVPDLYQLLDHGYHSSAAEVVAKPCKAAGEQDSMLTNDANVPAPIAPGRAQVARILIQISRCDQSTMLQPGLGAAPHASPWADAQAESELHRCGSSK
jgi:hypothetical protein